MNRPRLRPALLALLACAVVAAACGKKGPPLPPLVLLPNPPGEVAAVRRGERVDLSFPVPSANTDRSTPADLERIDVYTGADGSFSLYEDTGRDYGYERGEFSRIPLAWNQRSGELTIGAREGAYPGMQAGREIHVRFIDGPRADAGAVEPKADTSVRYDGKPLVVKKR